MAKFEGMAKPTPRKLRSPNWLKLGTMALVTPNESGLADASVTACIVKASGAVTRPGGEAVAGLNELECVEGQVWANVWPTDEIIRIDPGTGTVTASADAATLRRGEPDVNVLNGIAYAGDGEYLITGKNWSMMYWVRFDAA